MAESALLVSQARLEERGIEIEPSPRRVRVKFNGVTIADSKRVKLLREIGLVPTYYFPQDDVRMDLMTPTDRHSVCGYKGQASYWTLAVGDRDRTAAQGRGRRLVIWMLLGVHDDLGLRAEAGDVWRACVRAMVVVEHRDPHAVSSPAPIADP